jgi:hypothetical protein
MTFVIFVQWITSSANHISFAFNCSCFKRHNLKLKLPITTFNTSIKPFITLPKDNIVNNKKYDAFIKRYKKGEYYDNVSVLISEWANSGDLLDYIKNNYKSMQVKHWRSIISAYNHAPYFEFYKDDIHTILMDKINNDYK